MKRKKILALSMLLLSFLILETQTAIGQKQITLRFVFQDRIGSVMPILSVKKGFFTEQKLNIKALRFSSGPACAEALYSGSADLGTMGATTAIITVSRNDNFKIIASHAAGEHRHRVMVRQESKLETIKDLQGKRLAVKKGTSTYGGLLAALEAAQISQESIHIIDLTPPTMTDALLAGSIDAFVASEPTPSVAEDKGARELTTLGGLGNQYPILILAKDQLLQNHPQSIKRFLKAMREAQNFAAKHPEETAKIMAAETGLKPATARQAIKRHTYRLCLDKSILDSLKNTATFLKNQNIISQIPDFKNVVRADFLDGSVYN